MASSSDLALLPSFSNLNLDEPNLMSVPYEIRQNILKFACHGIIDIRLKWTRHTDKPHVSSYSFPQYSILQACKQLHNEAHSILLDQISLQVDCSSTEYWGYHPNEVISRFLHGLYGSTELLEMALQSVKQITLTFGGEFVCYTSLQTSLFINRFPALRELHLGNFTSWTQAFGVTRISEVRDIGTKSGMSGHWVGCQALHLRFIYFQLIEDMLLSKDRRFKLTCNVDLVDSNEESTAVRWLIFFCSPQVQTADFIPEGRIGWSLSSANSTMSPSEHSRSQAYEQPE